MRTDLETYLSENCLVKTDRASMLASLEVRVPYLDETVLERILRSQSMPKYLVASSKHCSCHLRVASCPGRCGMTKAGLRWSPQCLACRGMAASRRKGARLGRVEPRSL